MSEVQLNLTRKWRPQTFDQVFGQDLAIKMVKNSLYRGQLFPVYLLWGQHGTGKTSMARVFAAAINCHALPLFQQDPKSNPVPCLTCPSCAAMSAGNHPDFIEIDAASNTGVDQVRQIIEGAALLPLMGRKKIYLIDEAHMLSKAAFNAFLKILEEPPASALFMLATTDPQKIIETVRSRCFQLCLRAVDASSLIEHMRLLCSQEAIYADNEALDLIARETKGSVRDAINLLEQVRFAQGRVSRDAVLRVLGYIDDGRLIELLHIACHSNSQALLRFFSDVKIEQYSADFIWRRLLEIVRMAVWASYGQTLSKGVERSTQFAMLAKQSSQERLTILLDMFCSHERLFLRTTNKHLLLEMLLLKISRRNDSGSGPTMGSLPQQVAAHVIPEQDAEDFVDQDDEEEDDNEADGRSTANSAQHDVVAAEVGIGAAPIAATNDDQLWQSFIDRVNELNDPLLSSIFKHGCSVSYDRSNARIDVTFGKQFAFFSEWLESTKKLWLPLLSEKCAQEVIFTPHFTAETAATPVVNAVPTIAAEAPARVHVASAPTKSFGYNKTFNRSQNVSTRKPLVDVSDAQQWPVANLFLRYFPGIIREG